MLWMASLIGLMAMGGMIIGDDADIESGGDDAGDDGALTGPPEPETGTGVPDLLASAGASQGGDILSGTAESDSLAGGDGIDQINGYGGDDLLDGGSDDDHLYGGEGTDTILGGDGDDMAHGGQDDDTLLGGEGNDALHGNYGNDTLLGGAGLDSLFGGVGDDLVSGADDAGERDYLNGGDGDDTLVAGANDVLTLGDGADQIITGSWITAGASIEIIDFDAAEDQLVLLWDLQDQPDPDIQITTDPDAPEQSIIRINGTETLRLNSSAGITAADIVLLDQNSYALAAHVPV